MKPGKRETLLHSTLAELTTLGKQHQKALEELTDKLLITATNLNMVFVRLAVTERIVKSKLGLTDADIEQAADDAMAADRAQRAEEKAKADAKAEAGRSAGPATSPHGTRL